jgi:hypothetical protein
VPLQYPSDENAITPELAHHLFRCFTQLEVSPVVGVTKHPLSIIPRPGVPLYPQRLHHPQTLSGLSKCVFLLLLQFFSSHVGIPNEIVCNIDHACLALLLDNLKSVKKRLHQTSNTCSCFLCDTTSAWACCSVL